MWENEKAECSTQISYDRRIHQTTVLLGLKISTTFMMRRLQRERERDSETLAFDIHPLPWLLAAHPAAIQYIMKDTKWFTVKI